MTDKQRELLGLLKEVDTICRRHGLRYVMAGGSMIGVIRNRGFVPWDDDIDIYMPREDWERFVEICKTEAPEHRITLDMKTYREYSNSFPRYGRTEGCVIHRHQLLTQDVAGEIIDILTLDPIPASDKLYEKQYRQNLLLYSELTNATSVYGDRYEVPALAYIWQIVKKKLFGREKVYSDLEKKMFSWKEEDCPRVAMRWGGCPFLFDKEMFFPTKEMPFEDMMVQVPARCSDYLIWHYGDEWAYVPPHGDRESHDTIEPPLVGYKEFRAEYQPVIGTDKILRHAFFRKAFQLAGAKKNHKADQRRRELLAGAIALDLEKRIEALAEPLSTLAEERRFAELSELFAPYLGKQLSADFVGREDFANIHPFYHPVLVPIPEDVFFVVLTTLLYTERVRWADRLLKIHDAQKGECEEGRVIRDTITRFRSAVNDHEQGDDPAALSAMEKLAAQWPANPSFDKFILKLTFLRWQKALKEGDEKASGYQAVFVKNLESLSSRLGEDGFTEKYQADLLLSEGRKDEAIALYQKAYADTTNGVIWLEIDDILDELDLTRTQEDLAKEEERLAKTGYPGELIPYRLKYLRQTRQKDGRGIPSFEEEELSFLSSFGASPLERGEAEKLLGDILLPQGRVKEAFTHYRKARDLIPSGPDRDQIDIRILKDLYQGERRFRAYASRTDTVDYLDGWLDKYGSLEDLQSLCRNIAAGESSAGREKAKEGMPC